jgi:hypothetical protein
MHRLFLFLTTLILVSPLLGCARLQLQEAKTLEDYRMRTDLPDAFTLTETAKSEIASRTPAADCLTTTAALLPFEAPSPYSPNAPWTGFFWFGSDYLWTALRTDGVWADLPHNKDGYTQKIAWWSSMYSLKDEPEPALVVMGKRLDAESPPLKFYGATNASAADIGDAMMTGVVIPTSGCWEITGQYKKTELKFVVWLSP